MKILGFLGGSYGHTLTVLALSLLTTGLLVTRYLSEATWQSTVIWLFGTYGLGGAVAAYRDAFKPSAP